MRTVPPLVVLASLVALAGCGGSRAASSAASPASPTSPGQPTAACAATPNPTPGPVNDPNGPFFHQVWAARTDDGVTLREARQVLDHASVPDGVRLPDGSVRIYYVNGAEGGVWVARLDGETAVPLGPIAIDDVLRPLGVVDPDAVRLPDGRIRLAYLSGFGSPGTSTARAICLADSTDGERFRVVGAALTLTADDATTDPSLVQLRSGSWLMALSRGRTTVLARSADGRTFVMGETLAFGGVPELARLDDGRVRLYVCAAGIESYVSSDEGATWQREASVVGALPGGGVVCDPSMVAGTDVFLYKTQR
jgi:hypothetical protein